MTALKVIPWSDVIEAAPGLVKGARKIFARSPEPEPPQPAADPSQRVAQLEAGIAQLVEQQQASARLVESLAEQNARIVEAVDILRMRIRFLTVLTGVLGAVLAAAVVWGTR